MITKITSLSLELCSVRSRDIVHNHAIQPPMVEKYYVFRIWSFLFYISNVYVYSRAWLKLVLSLFPLTHHKQQICLQVQFESLEASHLYFIMCIEILQQISVFFQPFVVKMASPMLFSSTFFSSDN